ncbi:MAG: tRNA-Thr(GGU) m(6)t(6)A37 methyltransferase TsaA [Kiritimatiellia bacterium]|jgi:tRNA-Thr(GGU) m(6)t(6)A37 methyltransferase TsaA
MVHLDPIAHIRTPFPDKFAVPRQAGLATAARGELHLPAHMREAVHGLQGTSHLWLIFVFDRIPQGKWRPRVRPPRLGGDQSMGVFATRSPFRPNPIGLSVVELAGIRQVADGVVLDLDGVDLVDGTPILDIKPYVPYADCVPHATMPWVDGPPRRIALTFDPAPAAYLASRPALRTLIEQTLSLDPRPATSRGKNRRYAARLADVDVRWRVEDERFVVERITDDVGS